MTANGGSANAGQGLGGTLGGGGLDAGHAMPSLEAALPLDPRARAEAEQRARNVGSLRRTMGGRALGLVLGALSAAGGTGACASEVREYKPTATEEDGYEGTGGEAGAPSTTDSPDTQEAAESELKERYFQAAFAGDTVFFTGNYPQKIVIKGFATQEEAESDKSSSKPLMEVDTEGNGGDFENVPYQFDGNTLLQLPPKIFLRCETLDGQKIDITNDVKETEKDPNKIYGLNFLPTPTLK